MWLMSCKEGKGSRFETASRYDRKERVIVFSKAAFVSVDCKFRRGKQRLTEQQADKYPWSSISPLKQAHIVIHSPRTAQSHLS